MQGAVKHRYRGFGEAVFENMGLLRPSPESQAVFDALNPWSAAERAGPADSAEPVESSQNAFIQTLEAKEELCRPLHF